MKKGFLFVGLCAILTFFGVGVQHYTSQGQSSLQVQISKRTQSPQPSGALPAQEAIQHLDQFGRSWKPIQLQLPPIQAKKTYLQIEIDAVNETLFLKNSVQEIHRALSREPNLELISIVWKGKQGAEYCTASQGVTRVSYRMPGNNLQTTHPIGFGTHYRISRYDLAQIASGKRQLNSYPAGHTGCFSCGC